MKNYRWTTLFLLALISAFLPTTTRAADDAITPYINAKTDAVIHIDMSRIDMDALNAYYAKNVDAAPIDAAQQDAMKQKATERLAVAADWIANFKKAGGKDAYVLLEVSGMFTGEGGYAVVVPLAEGADAAALAKLLNPDGTPPEVDAQTQTTAVVGKNLIFSTSGMITAMKTAQGEARPDLTDALAVGADSPVHIALAMKRLATLAPLLGGLNAPPAKFMSDPAMQGVTWTGVAVTLPPKGAGKATLQCKDAASTTALVNSINAGIEKMKQDPKAKASLGDNVDKVAAQLAPTTDGTKVTVSIDQPTLDMMMPGMIKDSIRGPAGAGPAGEVPATAATGAGWNVIATL